MSTLIHAVRYLGARSDGHSFWPSLVTAEAHAWEFNLANPKCAREAKYFDKAPVAVSYPAETPMLSLSWTSAYDGGGHDYHASALTVDEVLEQVAHISKQVPAEMVRTLADKKLVSGVKVQTSRKWNEWVKIAYVGTMGEIAAKDIVKAA